MQLEGTAGLIPRIRDCHPIVLGCLVAIIPLVFLFADIEYHVFGAVQTSSARLFFADRTVGIDGIPFGIEREGGGCCARAVADYLGQIGQDEAVAVVGVVARIRGGVDVAVIEVDHADGTVDLLFGDLCEVGRDEVLALLGTWRIGEPVGEGRGEPLEVALRLEYLHVSGLSGEPDQLRGSLGGHFGRAALRVFGNRGFAVFEGEVKRLLRTLVREESRQIDVEFACGGLTGDLGDDLGLSAHGERHFARGGLVIDILVGRDYLDGDGFGAGLARDRGGLYDAVAQFEPLRGFGIGRDAHGPVHIGGE